MNEVSQPASQGIEPAQPAVSGDVETPRRRRTRHGVFGSKLPDGCQYVARKLSGLTRQMEAAVIERHGKVTLYHASLIQSAARHECRCQLYLRYLRSEPILTLAERVQLLDAVGRATDARDKCTERLGIDKAIDPADAMWAAIEQGRQDANATALAPSQSGASSAELSQPDDPNASTGLPGVHASTPMDARIQTQGDTK